MAIDVWICGNPALKLQLIQDISWLNRLWGSDPAVVTDF
jgi:hypothetical protein